MATYLLTMPAETGHVFPMLSVAEALHRRGHRVLAHVSPKFQTAVEATGATYVPVERYRDFLELIVGRVHTPPGWLPSFAHGLYRVRRGMRESARTLAEELEPLLRREQVDCLVADFFSLGARYAAERVGCRFATVASSGMAALSEHGVPVAPPQEGMKRAPRSLVFAAFDTLLPLRPVREALGLPRRKDAMPEFLHLMVSDELHLVTSPPGVLPDEPLRKGHALVGPMSFTPPRKERTPVRVEPGTLLVSTTTTAREDGFLARVLQGLAPLGMPVLATAAGAKELPVGLGAHVRIEPFIPHDEVMPQVRALVTHGGWGTVGRALRHGVPMVILSMFGDQPAIGRRMAQLGLARHLPAAKATPELIRAEVQAMLGDSGMLRRAKAMAEKLETLDSPVLAAELLERLVRQGSEVR